METCRFCAKDLRDEERALFVEEEVGRIFCSEDCISSYFSTEVERLEKEYVKYASNIEDLSGEEKENYAHLRWLTLQEPDEVWRQKTLAGDYRYTLISEFEPGDRPIYCVCICLFLRGEPSFLYLAFPTKSVTLVDLYRRGERVEWVKPRQVEGEHPQNLSLSEGAGDGSQDGTEQKAPIIDGLADEWTEEETLRAELSSHRAQDDIPEADFENYQACLEESLESPDEVWSLNVKGKGPLRLYHFLKNYQEKEESFWYVVVARETDQEDEIELLDAFPTRDMHLVERYRQGDQEVGFRESRPQSSRVVH